MLIYSILDGSAMRLCLENQADVVTGRRLINFCHSRNIRVALNFVLIKTIFFLFFHKILTTTSSKILQNIPQ